MNIVELEQVLQGKKINITAREISKIWDMNEQSYSKKKKIGSQIKFKNIKQLEEALNIKILQEKKEVNNLSRQFDESVFQKIKTLGERLDIIQEKNGLSDEKMAVLLDVSKDLYKEIKLGKIKPNIEFINSLKQNFKISVDWFLYGD